MYAAPVSTWNPAVTQTIIDPTDWNTLLSDLSTALTTCLTKDGQTVPTANLPMGGFKHTGVGDATARTHYASAGQVQDNSICYAGVAGGTANAITLTPTIAITSYATGSVFLFKAAANNTAATTVAISGLASPKAIQLAGQALVGGEILNTKFYAIMYDGTAFQLNQVFSNPGVVTPTRTTANITAIAGSDILADVSGGTLTVSLMASPIDGQQVAITDELWNSATNNITVSGNGNNVAYGASTDTSFLMNVNGLAVRAVWDAGDSVYRISI